MRKTKLKRCLAVMLSATLSISLFGCGQKESQQPETKENQEQTAAIEAGQKDNAEEVVLKNVDRYPLEGSPKVSIGVCVDNPEEEPIFSIMADAIGVDPEYQILTNEQITMLFAGNELPDIFFAHNGRLPSLTMNQINDYGNAGMLVNYADYLDQMPNLKRLYEEHPEWFSAVMTLDGDFYTIPSNVFTLIGSIHVLHYRTDHAALAGWDKAPTTIDEFTQFLRDLKTTMGANDPDYIPFSAYNSAQMRVNDRLCGFLFPSFGDLMECAFTVAPDGKTVVAGFATEQYQRYLKYLKSLMEEGLLNPDAFTANGDLINAAMMEGHMSVNTRMAHLPIDIFETGQYELALFSPFASEYNDDPKWKLNSMADYWLGMINTECENLDAALAYIDACFAPEDDPLNEEGTLWGISWWLGELNYHWKWLDEGSYMSIEHLDAEGNKISMGGYSTAPNIGFFDKVRYNEKTGKADYLPVDTKEKLLPYGVELIYVKDLTLTEDEREVYNDTWPDISTYLDQMNAAFVIGEANVDTEFEAFVANLEKMGLQDIIDVYQAALDRYLAK